MTNEKNNQFNLVSDKDEVLVYEVPTTEVNLMDQEQLEELKKPAALFFDCENYIVQADAIHFFYKKESGYKNIEFFRNKNQKLMKKVALQLLQIENLIGTQYTTIIHPKNIFMKSDGSIKLAHRGIRNVFPNQTMRTARIVTDIRKLFIYLYSDIPYELIEESTYHLQLNDPLLIKIQQSKTLHELKTAVEQENFKQQSENNSKADSKHKTQIEKKMKEKPLQRLSPLTAILIGLIVGMGIIYLMQVIPLNNTSAKEIATTKKQAEDEIKELTEEKSALEQDLKHQGSLINAYQAVSQGEIEDAVTAFESLQSLTETDEQLLFELYLEQNTVESLSNGLELDEEYELPAIWALATLDSEEAKEIVTAWDSERNEVKIEQAYLNNDYERVVELLESLADNDRAKSLAAFSYIEMGEHEEALEIGEQLESKQIQIASLEKEKELLSGNDELDDDEKEAREKEVNEELENLR